MKEFKYNNIVDDDGNPISEWVTDEEFEKRTKSINEIVEFLRKSYKNMSEEKTLDVVSIEDAKEKISDLQFVGNGNLFKVLVKASSKSQGWMKSTKGMEVAGLGVLVQVTTQNYDNVAEALTFVPGATIVADENGGNKLVQIPFDL